MNFGFLLSQAYLVGRLHWMWSIELTGNWTSVHCSHLCCAAGTIWAPRADQRWAPVCVRKRARWVSWSEAGPFTRSFRAKGVCVCARHTILHHFTALIKQLLRLFHGTRRVCNSSRTRSFERGHDEDKLVNDDLRVQIIARNDCNKLVKSCVKWAVARNQHPRCDDFRRSHAL